MKKKTGRYAAAFISALLSVIFFFVSSLFVQTCSINERFRNRYSDENFKDSIVSSLFDSKTEDLSQKVFKAYFNGNRKLNVSCPAEYREDQSNFFFIAKDSSGKVILQNYYTEDYSYHETKTVTVEFSSDDGDLYETDTVTVDCYLRSDFIAKDSFYRAFTMINVSEHIEISVVMAVLFGALSLWCFVKCLKVFYIWGKKGKKSSKLSLVSADMLFAALLPVMVFCTGKIAEGFDSKLEVIRQYALFGVGENQFFRSSLYQTLLFSLIVIVLATAVYGIAFGGRGYLVSFIRYKKFPFTHGSVIYFVVVQFIKSLAIGLYFSTYTNFVLMLLLFEKLITLPVLFKSFREMQMIMEKTKSYVDGDLSSSIDSKGYFKTFADHAEDIKSVTDRISISADEYIQSSKFKAELITNLSHDIKTPLTSILNYAQLLKKENLSKEEKEQFLSVLGRHSVRLQKLIEDLVEVSDATSGKISVKPAQIDLCSLIPQIVVGFEERLLKRKISMELSLPEKPVNIIADTRLLWRVIDNLMNNICKYAKEGTAAEIVVFETDNEVTVKVTNVSAYKIEISGEELTERFTRADSSRHTDGSGLGLSIAKSLMELMNGTLKIETEKDKFSAQVIFLRR